MKLSMLLTQQNIQKSFAYIRNYGLREFFYKARTIIFDAKESSFQPETSAERRYLTNDFKEQEFAKAYLQAVLKNPSTFIEIISLNDEMYLFTRESVSRKETARYLYFKSGMECFQNIKHIVQACGKEISGVRLFLDFAAGYGRVTRFLIQEIEPNRIWVGDIYKEAVDFQKKYFGVNGFYSETEPAQLEFPGKFEVIYVGSLFSHLPANRFKEWLARLYDVLDDDGILIFSTHGGWLCPAGIQMDQSGFLFIGQSESSSLSTHEYGSTYVTRSWVERIADESDIDHIYFMERGLCDFQDIYVVSKREFPSLNNLKMGNALKGNIDSVHYTDAIHIAGWALDKNSGAPVKEVCIYLNNELLGYATIGLQRPDVSHYFQRADYLNSGWEFRADDSILENRLGARCIEAGLIRVSVQNDAGESTDLFSPFTIDMMKDNATGQELLPIQNQGTKKIPEKAAKKVLVADDASPETPALQIHGAPEESRGEYALARAYIDSVAKNPGSFVDRVAAGDEMYSYIRNNIVRKEDASYLYFKTGKEALQSIENIIQSSGKTFEHIQSFLDFASGYGRATRFLIQEIDPSKVWVSDIYEGAVDFQKEYFGVNGFYSETDPRKLQFPREFEMIYVGSLFSHLPMNRFRDWLSRLYAILEDDGILIFSTHGESLCPPENKLDPSGFTFLGMSESGSLSVSEYGSTFVTRACVERIAKELGITFIYFLERELWAQDMYVITRNHISSLEKLLPNNYPKGNIESVNIDGDGTLVVKGWATEREIGSPVREVSIYAGNERLGKATLGITRSDVAEHFQQPKFAQSGWEYTGRCLLNADKKKPTCIIIKVLIMNHQDKSICLVSSCGKRS